MDNMRFGTFSWPNNPEKYEEKCAREPVYVKDENGNATFAGMGVVKRIITGSGAFFGNGAYDSFKNLQALISLTEPADLTHPVWGVRSVYLTELDLTMEPREDYVAYSFIFREANGSGGI